MLDRRSAPGGEATPRSTRAAPAAEDNTTAPESLDGTTLTNLDQDEALIKMLQEEESCEDRRATAKSLDLLRDVASAPKLTGFSTKIPCIEQCFWHGLGH